MGAGSAATRQGVGDVRLGARATRREHVRELLVELLGVGWESWRLEGACIGADPELFIGVEGEDEGQKWAREKVAKDVCAGCSVRGECLDVALANKERGVWGQTTDAERRRMHKGQMTEQMPGRVSTATH